MTKNKLRQMLAIFVMIANVLVVWGQTTHPLPQNGKVYRINSLGVPNNLNTPYYVTSDLYKVGSNNRLVMTSTLDENDPKFYFRADGSTTNQFSLYSLSRKLYFRPSVWSNNDSSIPFGTAEAMTFTSVAGTTDVPTHLTFKYGSNSPFGADLVSSMFLFERGRNMTSSNQGRFIFTEVNASVITIVSNIGNNLGATYTVNNRATINNRFAALIGSEANADVVATVANTVVPAGYQFLGFTWSGQTTPQTSLTLTRQQLEQNRDLVVTANFMPTSANNGIFVSSVSDANTQGKWFVIRSSRTGMNTQSITNNEYYGWRLKEDGTTVANTPISAIDDRSLWCFVGNAANFQIYNKAVGNKVAITSNGAFTNGTAVVMADQNTARFWTLGYKYVDATSEAGVTFHLNGDTYQTQSANAYEGVGLNVKFYEAGDGGSRWIVEQPGFLLSDFLSDTYGQKWVRLHWSNPKFGTDVALTLKNASNTSNYVNRGLTVAKVDLTDNSFLWCLVKDGQNGSFKMYNKQVGNSFAVTVDNTNSGTHLKLVTSTAAGTWSLGTGQLYGKDNPGLILFPNGSNNQSPNLFGGALGADVGLWAHNDGGSRWLVRDAGLVATITPNVTGSVGSGETYRPLSIGVTNGPVVVSSLSFPSATTAVTAYLSRKVKTTFNTITNINYTNVTFPTNDVVVAEAAADFTVNATWNPDAAYVFTNPSATGNYPYREVAIAVAPNGDILTFSDLRKNTGDAAGNEIGRGSGVIDVVSRVKPYDSEWSQQVTTIAAGVESDSNTKGYSSAAVTADNTANKVLIMMQTGNVRYDASTNATKSRIAQTVYSNESGQWTAGAITDQTDAVYSLFPNAYGVVFASGRLLQSKVVKQGDYYRVYGAVSVRKDQTAGRETHVVYTDDFGTTWKRLGGASSAPAVTLGNGLESKLEETTDGSLILSSRGGANRRFNVFKYATTTDAVATGNGAWGSNYVEGLTSTGRNGDILLVKAKKTSDSSPVTLALQTTPTGATSNNSTNVKVFYKELNTSDLTAATVASAWTNSYPLSTTTSQNATMDLQRDGKVGFLYEENLVSNGYDIVYQALDLGTITGGAYTFDREVAATTANEVLKQRDFVGGYTTTEAADVATAKESFTNGEMLLRTLEATVGNLKKTGTPIAFDANKYYRLYTTDGNVVATNYAGGTTTEAEDATKVSQFWKVSEIGTNATVINPNEPQVGATNIAVTSTDGVNFRMNLRNRGEASYRLKPIATVGVKVLAGRIYGTFYYPFAVSITDQTDATFYKSTANQPDRVLTTSVSGSVSKETPVIVKATNSNDATDQVFRLAIDYSNTQTNLNDANLVQGVLVPTQKSAGSIYIMAKASRGEGFYKTTADGVLAANKAFLNATTTTGASFLPFADGEEPTTGISGMVTDSKVVKYYNLNGTPVAKPVSGVMYITSDGKKLIFK